MGLGGNLSGIATRKAVGNKYLSVLSLAVYPHFQLVLDIHGTVVK